MPAGEKDTEVAVFSSNPDVAFDDPKNLDLSVTIDHSVNAPKNTPLVFTNLQRTVPYRPKGGGKSYQTPVFRFEYNLPIY